MKKIILTILAAATLFSCTHKEQYCVHPNNINIPDSGIVFIIDTNLETKINNTYIVNPGLPIKWHGHGWLLPVNQCGWYSIGGSLYESKVLPPIDSPLLRTISNFNLDKNLYTEYYIVK